MEENVKAAEAAAGTDLGEPGGDQTATYVMLTEEDLKSMLQEAAKTAIKELKREESKERKRNKYHDTFSLMKCYRDAVFHIENAVSEGTQLEIQDMTEEQQETYLRSVRRTRFRTMLMTANVDKAIDEMERRRTVAGREMEYKVFDMYFMQGMGYEEIIEQVEKDTGERLGKNTPRRWVTAIINEMSVLLWGFEDEREIDRKVETLEKKKRATLRIGYSYTE